MLMIISKEKIDGAYDIQSQSHRTSVWLDGYIKVPENLIEKAWESCGYCNLVFDDAGNLVDLELTEKPTPEEPTEPTSNELNVDDLAKAIKEGVNAI